MIPARRARRFVWPLLMLALTACGGDVAPFQWAPRPAPYGAAETGQRIGICYNGFFTTPDQVRAAALEACGPEAVPELLHQDMRFNCPLLTPVRATFLCVPPG